MLEPLYRYPGLPDAPPVNYVVGPSVGTIISRGKIIEEFDAETTFPRRKKVNACRTGEAGCSKRVTIRQAEIMNIPSPAAFIKYSGQCLFGELSMSPHS